MTEPRRIPKLASDTRRGYLMLIVATPITLAVPFALVLLDAPVKASELAAATLFISWSFIGFFTSIVTILVFSGASHSELRRWMVATTPRDRKSRFIYLLNGGGAAGWAITGSVIAVAAVLILSFTPQFRQSPVVVVAGIAVVVGSLFMTITAYAVRYARQYATAGGIEFPGDEQPRFSDFIYLAVQVSTTFSTSDVSLTESRARNLVTANSLVSFAFNTVIVALLVSVLVGASA